MIRTGGRCVEPFAVDIFARMITLHDLAAWESRVAMIVAQAGGDPEERDRALERWGLYAEYPAILSGYLALLEDEGSRLEALKRAVFLVWYSAVEPPMLSGISELPESAVRAALEELERACREAAIDDEMRWMLAWYHSVGDLALLRTPGLPSVEALVAEEDPLAWEDAETGDGRMKERGLLGRYWSSLGRRDGGEGARP
jgi:hypothetical protein